jgi:sulfhydrogenase subunit beta (sulfur reductase)
MVYRIDHWGLMVANIGFLARKQFGELMHAIKSAGYQIVGPTLKDGAIIYTDIESVDLLPEGIVQSVRPGEVRTSATEQPRYFAWANGPQAIKPLLFKPVETIWKVERDSKGQMNFIKSMPNTPPTAVIGVRACDLAALKLQDQHFLHGAYVDAHYAKRREQLLLVAVNCTHPAETCFCASTGDGPEVTDGYDVLLDELDTGFIVQIGSDRGQAVLEGIELGPVAEEVLDEAVRSRRAAGEVQTRSIPPGDLFDVLHSNAKHPHWDEVASRCLSCGNCTQVCPTCFCSREVDETDLAGTDSTHNREWDSCFSESHSYITGKTIRHEVKHRYRQWLTHKLGGWHRQYGRSGCVGCGRCIAWCPTGIDICEEVNVIAGTAKNE